MMKSSDKLNPKDLYRKTEAELRQLQKDGSLSNRDRERVEKRLREKDRGNDSDMMQNLSDNFA